MHASGGGIQSIPVDIASPSGWTTFLETSPFGEGSSFAGSGTRKVYVSSSAGSDSNPGTLSSPVATIAHGITLIRSGHDDWLLLKCGDTFLDDFVPHNASYSGSGMVVSPAWTVTGNHTVSGVVLFASYGVGAPPHIKVTGSNATGDAYWQFENTGTANSVAWVNWKYDAYTRNPADPGWTPADASLNYGCFAWLTTSTNLLFEDNEINFFAGGISKAFGNSPFNQIWSGVVIRRNLIQSNYLLNAEAQGFFVAGADTLLLIEENYFNSNGYLASAGMPPNNAFVPKNHNIYMDSSVDGSTVIIRNNIFTGEMGGLQIRGGGEVYNNYHVRNAIIGAAAGKLVTWHYDVIQELIDVPSGSTAGTGPQLNPCVSGSAIDNIIVSNETSSSGFGLQVGGPSNSIGGGAITGNFNGTSTVSNVDSASNTNNAWPNNIFVGGNALIPANTFVTGQNFSAQNPGTVTFNNATTGTATGTGFSQVNHGQNVSNCIIFDQVGGIQDNGTSSVLTNNDANGSGTYPDPTRSAGSYDLLQGGPGTTDNFLAVCGQQHKQGWNPAYTAAKINNYIRGGFNRPQL